MMNDNNVFGTKLGALNVSVQPSAIPPAADYTKIEFPALGGVYFCPSSKDYGTQSFILFDAQDGSGQYAQFGTFTQPMKNWAFIGDNSALENFQIADGPGLATLFAVTGTGITKVMRLSRIGNAPTCNVIATNLGATGAVAISAIGCSDSAFQVAITAGGAGITAGNLFHVTFNRPFLNKPIITFSMEGASNTSLGNFVLNNVTVNGFDCYYPNVPTAGGPQLVNFLVVG